MNPTDEPHNRPDHETSVTGLLARCTFPEPGSRVACAYSGGPDSTALIVLAERHGLDVRAHHVDHGLRPDSGVDAESARAIAEQVGVEFVVHVADIGDGPNLEARARAARRSLIPADAMTGHTADDQAETLLLRLLRGSGRDGLTAMEPGPAHPILALRRAETESICAMFGLDPVRDPSNDVADVWRNRVRAELLPLATDIARRDLVPILTRTADLLRDERDVLDDLAAAIDPTDARAVAGAPRAIARRSLRHWLTLEGYPPDAASIERVLDVAAARALACELPGGRRVERSNQRLRVVAPDR